MIAPTFRNARRDDVPAVLTLLQDDSLGAAREGADMAHYLAAFDAMAAEGGNLLIVGELGDQIIATYQLTLISGLSLRASRRAQIESVRVASNLRGQGLGRAMFKDAKSRAIASGCSLMQLTMNTTRSGSAKFYETLGFVPSHTGFKLSLETGPR